MVAQNGIPQETNRDCCWSSNFRLSYPIAVWALWPGHLWWRQHPAGSCWHGMRRYEWLRDAWRTLHFGCFVCCQHHSCYQGPWTSSVVRNQGPWRFQTFWACVYFQVSNIVMYNNWSSTYGLGIGASSSNALTTGAKAGTAGEYGRLSPNGLSDLPAARSL